MSKYNAARYANDAEYRRHVLDINNRSRLRKLYGMEPRDYERLLGAQGGGCAICGAGEGNARNKRLTVDHDHANGQVRGLLCQRCNSAMGMFNDDAQLMGQAIEYLRRNDA